MAKRTKTSNAPALTSPLPPADVQTFEVFGRPNAAFGLIRTDSREASCFNGQVAVTRYRVTIEAIPEPVEVVAARVEALMRDAARPRRAAARSPSSYCSSRSWKVVMTPAMSSQ